MNEKEVIHRLNALMAYAELFLNEAAVLKKELEGSGVPDSSAPRGVISKEEKQQILLSRKRKRIEKATG